MESPGQIERQLGSRTLRIDDPFQAVFEVERPAYRAPFMELGDNLFGKEEKYIFKQLRVINNVLGAPAAILVGLAAGIGPDGLIKCFNDNYINSARVSNPFNQLKASTKAGRISQLHKLDTALRNLDGEAPTQYYGAKALAAATAWVQEYMPNARNSSQNLKGWDCILSPQAVGLFRQDIKVNFTSAQSLLLNHALRQGDYVDVSALNKLRGQMSTVIESTSGGPLIRIPQREWGMSYRRPGAIITTAQELELYAK